MPSFWSSCLLCSSYKSPHLKMSQSILNQPIIINTMNVSCQRSPIPSVPHHLLMHFWIHFWKLQFSPHIPWYYISTYIIYLSLGIDFFPWMNFIMCLSFLLKKKQQHESCASFNQFHSFDYNWRVCKGCDHLFPCPLWCFLFSVAGLAGALFP